jgi:hypothetical protein
VYFTFPYYNESGKGLIKRHAVGKVDESSREDSRRFRMIKVCPRSEVFAH